jgi:thiamine pyrophosphate-dependent acetolactate synthase large subunit-like protein
MSSMLRTEALEALARHRKGMVAFVTMRAVEAWEALGQGDHGTYNVMGCMGVAASCALGLAIARPDQPILVIDGDGSLAMQLGSLMSIATVRPKRLIHVVMENGTYETSGGQAVPGRGVSDFTKIALASGYRHAFRLSSTEEIDTRLPECLGLDGPVFISVVITGPGVVRAAPAGPGGPNQIQRAAAQLKALRQEFTAEAVVPPGGSTQ